MLSRIRRYGLAIVATAAANVATALLWQWVQPSASIMFFPAVISAALYGGLGPALVATALSALSIGYFFIPPFYSLNVGADDVIRIAVFVAVAMVTASLSAARQRAEQEQRRAIVELKKALAKVQRLSSLLPMCPVCKNVRNDQGYWTEVHAFLKEDAGLELSHALCPTCAATHYKEFHAPQPAESEVASGVRDE